MIAVPGSIPIVLIKVKVKSKRQKVKGERESFTFYLLPFTFETTRSQTVRLAHRLCQGCYRPSEHHQGLPASRPTASPAAHHQDRLGWWFWPAWFSQHPRAAGRRPVAPGVPPPT